jgi:DMSO/TMAO reductase YedYZ molybdopterin-dependent catalytic subunit
MARTRPGLLTGALVGGFLVTALIAIFFLAAALVGTPFVPFDLFDWVGRVLPGPVITFGIDTIVTVITALNIGELSSTAKIAEQIMAVGGMLVTGIVVGAVVFELLKRVRLTPGAAGLIAGLGVGLPVALISQQVNRTALTDDGVNLIWIVVAFVIWGLALEWAFRRIAGSETSTDGSSSVQQIDRRRFLINVGGATAAITVLGSGIGVLLNGRKPQEITVALAEGEGAQPWSASNTLPNADDVLVAAPGTRPELTPLADHYRIDINLVPPTVNEADWALKIDGLVDNPVDLTLDQIRSNYAPISQFVTIACISNRVGGDLIGTTLWTGARLKDVLADVGLKPEATHLRITAADDFDEITSIDLAMNDDRVMLCYAWDGLPLEVKHGFPLRIYLPNHYGMKQPKWITRIEAIPAWEEGYWVRRGWDKDALMKATSVIDTIATEAIYQRDGAQFVPIGGIAHAGDRGISTVEIKVDDGEWTPALLRKPLSETTWVIWRYDWPFSEGLHTFTVRCVDGDGVAQIVDTAPPRPSGATGLDTIDRSV